MGKRMNPFLKGLLVGVSGLLLLCVLVVIVTAAGYDGECGRILPFMGDGAGCGFWEYLRDWLPFNFRIIFYVYWYALAAILFLPAFILWGYHRWLVRRAAGSNPRS